MFPMSIPRNVSALRYASLMGFLCSVYLVLVVMIIFWTDKSIVPNPRDNWNAASLGKVALHRSKRAS